MAQGTTLVRKGEGDQHTWEAGGLQKTAEGR